MKRRLFAVRIAVAFLWPVLACSSVPGLAVATPTLWAVQPWISVPGQPELAATSEEAVLAATLAAPVPTGTNPVEVGILKCQNDPSVGVVRAQTPVVLVWGWSTDDQTKRDEFISISSFALEVDTQRPDLSNAQRILESATLVRWKLPIGELPPGTHEIRLTTILARSFSEAGGTYPSGPQSDEICHLVVQP